MTVAFAVALLAAAVLGGCGDSTDEAVTTTDGDQVAMESVEMADGTGVGIGQYPPSFLLPDLNGTEMSLSDFEGKVVVLDMWATWCPPCREEIPFLIKLYDEFEEQGLAIVGVGLDQGGAADLAPFVKSNSIDYTILVGDRAIGQAYKVSGIPTTFIIGRDGRIAAKHIGFSSEMKPEMRSEIVKLLGGDENA